MWLSSHQPDCGWVLCARLEAAALGGEGQPGAPRGSAPVWLQSPWFDDDEGVRWQRFRAVSLYLVSTLC